MSREAMSEEERRQRRNEASRRCYLKRKAELAAQAQPVGAKNHKSKAETKPARRGPDPIVAAERLCRTYAKVANGVKPMIKDAAEFLGIVYKSEDQRVVEKVERILTKGLGVKVGRLESDPAETTRVCVDAASKAVKTPKFRLTPAEPEQDVEPEPDVEPEQQPEIEDEPAEVPVDPAFLEKVDAGEADKSEIEIPQDKTDEDDEDDEDEIDSEDDEDEDEDDEDEDDEDDESEEAQERRVRRRRREESDNIREYESGRWDMMGEMGAQGAFDD